MQCKNVNRQQRDFDNALLISVIWRYQNLEYKMPRCCVGRLVINRYVEGTVDIFFFYRTIHRRRNRKIVLLIVGKYIIIYVTAHGTRSLSPIQTHSAYARNKYINIYIYTLNYRMFTRCDTTACRACEFVISRGRWSPAKRLS